MKMKPATKKKEAAEAPPPERMSAGPLGQEIKALRKARRKTLTELSLATSLSVGHLSQVERGISMPSIKALHSISRALDVNVSWFFSGADPAPADERDVIVRQHQRRHIRFAEGISDALLTPSLDRQLELLMSTFAPGATSGPQPYAHDGEEAGVVLSGQLELWIEERRFLLHQGDSFSFKSSLPHRYRNPADSETVVVWAITSPSF
jgi:transcriptional regulator with XRE-family HTH domain